MRSGGAAQTYADPTYPDAHQTYAGAHQTYADQRQPTADVNRVAFGR